MNENEILLTLDNETEAEAAKRQVGKHRLFLRLTHTVVSCVVATKLERQGKFSRLNFLFDLKRETDQYPRRCNSWK